MYGAYGADIIESGKANRHFQWLVINEKYLNLEFSASSSSVYMFSVNLRYFDSRLSCVHGGCIVGFPIHSSVCGELWAQGLL